MRVICTLSVFANKMKKHNLGTLTEFCKIALAVESARRLVKHCECCRIYVSEYLYVIKTLIFGIYHVCEDCKASLEINPAEGLVTFVKKFP